ncbi:NAD(P)-dependent oxidoreductase [Dankookia sp. P2]|uniref:NAD(P)-dependent oxidoreductase n=1 Tax=Dankookia sp. P2 TaxID=3423955 RepID=UPI003D67C6DF
MAFALLWDAARQTAMMDAAVRASEWPRVVGMQLTGKTIGLIGTGGIGAEMARLCNGIGMKVLAWNRSPKAMPGVEFTSLDRLLAESDAVSLHLLLNDETRGFLSAVRIAQMKRGAILVNTARGAVVDEAAMCDALESGQLGHAALDVFVEEPLPAGHRLRGIRNATLTSHAAFRTPEASGQPDRRGSGPLPADREGREVSQRVAPSGSCLPARLGQGLRGILAPSAQRDQGWCGGCLRRAHTPAWRNGRTQRT